MRPFLSLLLALILTFGSARAFAQAAPAPEAITDPWPGDANAARRETLFDVAFAALVTGDLIGAERAFAQAAALPGDPARSAVATSFLERVQRLRTSRRVDAQIESEPARRTRDPGRAERIVLLGVTTALGLGAYGWALPYAVGVDPQHSPKGFIGLYMVTASSSFVLPYFLLRDRPITAGQTNLAYYGGSRGLWHGVLIGSLLAGDLNPFESQGWFASVLLGSTVELFAGYQLAGRARLSAGETRTIAAMGDLGLLLGFGTGFLLKFDSQPGCPPEGCDRFSGFNPDADGPARRMSAAGLLGAGLGLGGGYLLARHRNNTWGDGEVMRGSMGLGLWVAGGIADVANMRFDFTHRPFTGLLMAGGALGALAGDRLVRNTNFTVGQSMLVDLSLLAGGLLGAGITNLATSNDDNEAPYVLSSGLGALMGYGLAYWAFHDAPESRASARLSKISSQGMTVLPLIGNRGERGLSLASAF